MLRLLLLIATQAFGQQEAAYQDGLNFALSNLQKSESSITSINPAEYYKDKNGTTYYTDNPQEVAHYGSSSVELENSGRDGVDKNNATKEVWKSFGKPKVKINPEDTWLSNSSNIIKNSADIVKGTSSKPEEIVRNGTAGINCKEEKVCRIDLVKKTCNEEANPIKRVCQKIPKITTSIKEVVYPDCRIVDVKQGAGASCPGGYDKILYADMVEGPIDDDVHICVRSVNAEEGSECLGGYHVSGKWNNIYGNGSNNEGTATVPKKTHARIRFSNIYGHGRYLPITIVNDTTGQMLYNNVRFYNGQVVDLPFSEIQDQVFRFYKSDRTSRGSWRDIGVVILYVDHMYKETVANLESWSEVNCNEG